MAVISRSTSVRLLVIRLSAMGDVAMVAPVLVALRRNYPNLRITVLTPKFLQPFFREVGNIEFFAPDLKGRHKGVAGLLRLGRDLGRFDMVADLHDVLRSKGLCRLMKLRGTRIERIDKGRAEKKMLTAPENKQRVQLKTTVERYREVFVRLGFDLPEIPLPSRIRYPMSEAVARLAGAHDGTWIGVSPFAQHEGNIYPLDKMREVMLRLARTYFRCRGRGCRKSVCRRGGCAAGQYRIGDRAHPSRSGNGVDFEPGPDGEHGLFGAAHVVVGRAAGGVRLGGDPSVRGILRFRPGPGAGRSSRYAVPALFGVWQQTLPVRRLPVYASDYARDDRKPGMRSVGRGNTLRECGLEKLLKQRFGRRPRFVSRQSYFWAYRGSPSTGPTPGKR